MALQSYAGTDGIAIADGLEQTVFIWHALGNVVVDGGL